MKIANRIFRIILILLIPIFFQNCYHYRVAVKSQPATEYQSVRVNSFFWGLRQKKIEIKNCENRYLQEVYVQSTLGNSIANVLTLGIWKPIIIKWKCAKDKPVGVQIGTDNMDKKQ